MNIVLTWTVLGLLAATTKGRNYPSAKYETVVLSSIQTPPLEYGPPIFTPPQPALDYGPPLPPPQPAVEYGIPEVVTSPPTADLEIKAGEISVSTPSEPDIQLSGGEIFPATQPPETVLEINSGSAEILQSVATEKPAEEFSTSGASIMTYTPPPEAPKIIAPPEPVQEYGPPVVVQPQLPSEPVLEYGPPPVVVPAKPVEEYGPPEPVLDYGTPKIVVPAKPVLEYGPPEPVVVPAKPVLEYGTPVLDQPPSVLVSDYGVPIVNPPKPFAEYKVPLVTSDYGPPKVALRYSAPLKPVVQYRPALVQVPRPVLQYGAPRFNYPSLFNQFFTYGAPRISPQRPVVRYSPPHIQLKYNAPHIRTSFPPATSYGIPVVSPIRLRAPIGPVFNYGPPRLHLRYGFPRF